MHVDEWIGSVGVTDRVLTNKAARARVVPAGVVVLQTGRGIEELARVAEVAKDVRSLVDAGFIVGGIERAKTVV